MSNVLRIYGNEPRFSFSTPEQRAFKTIREVAVAVAQEEGLTVEEVLQPPASNQDAVRHYARQRCYSICASHLLPTGKRRWSNQQIANVFGLRRGSTVCTAIKSYREATAK